MGLITLSNHKFEFTFKGTRSFLQYKVLQLQSK